jgi:hypothetical protein
MGDLLLYIVQALAGLMESAGKAGGPPALPGGGRTAAPKRIAGPGNAQRASNPRSVLNAPAMRQGVQAGRARAVSRPPTAAPAAKTAVAAPRAAAMSVAPATTVNRGRSGEGPLVTAGVIRKWATPTRLQQQYILTEIFQPPVGLRNMEE